MKNFTIKPNSKVAKTATFAFNYLHLIMIAVVLLLCNIESANAQSARAIAPEAQTATPDQELMAAANPNANVASLTAYSRGRQININATKIMFSVAVYDLSGRCVYSATSINSREHKTTPIDLPNQILVVKAIFVNDAIATKNIVLN